ncbi:hypothetical protein [Castellaniella sp.]|uniref:hypothetical protein n=1 Tax=Castellaniella sp. TaxID=1955812 RepID=UPI00355E6027
MRGIELASAKKENLFLDRGVWRIPDETVKTRKGFLVPIVPAVAAWFEALDVREEIPERRQALAMWADFLIACETGTSSPQTSKPTISNIIQFRKVAGLRS